MKGNSSMTKIFAIVSLVLCMGQAFAAWDGISETMPTREGGYFIIDSEAKLAWYAKHYDEGDAKLTADLDMGGKLWTPIAAGTGSAKYRKIFDGNNHVIKNLYINGSELAKIDNSYAQNLGFVGVLGGGTIKKLTLENVDIQASTNAGDVLLNKDQQISVGTFVGWMADNPNNVVRNSMVSGTIKTTGSGQGVGGIVGNAKNGTIVNCLSLVDIQTSGNKAEVGGIIGISKTDVSVSSCVYAGPGLKNMGTDGSVGGIAGSVLSGSFTAERDFYEGDGFEGIGSFCSDCAVIDLTSDVDFSNTDNVVCSLNGKNEDSSCKMEPWSVGETALSLNGYGPDGYKIVFDANGGAFADGTVEKNKFIRTGLAIVADEVLRPSRENNVFIGWSFTQDGTPVDDLGKVSGVDTVYAVWNPLYAITFDGSSGNYKYEKTKQVAKGDVITVDGLGDMPAFYCDQDLPESECTSKHYFTGWAMKKNATEADTVLLDTVTASDGLVLYAVWTTVTTYMVTYDANHHGKTMVSHARVDGGETVSKPENPIADEGYLFVDWFTEELCQNKFDFNTEIEKSLILYAKWQLVDFKINYHLDGASNSGDNPGTYTIETPTIVLKDPVEKEGHLFEGWFYDAEFTQKATQIILGTTGDKDLYAKWTKKTYKVTYLADNNSYGSVSDKYKEHGTPLALETSGFFFRPGYDQLGWTTAPEGKKDYSFGENYTANAPVVLYPAWSEPIKYKITYECNGCVNNPESPLEYTIDDQVALKKPDALSEYLFDGWFDNAEFTGKAVTEIPKGSFGDKTLYAKWLPTSFTISYVAGEGVSGTVASQKMKRNETVMLKNAGDFTRKGYSQDGWSTQEGGDKVYGLGAAYSENNDLVLYPHWVEGEVSVSYYGAVVVYGYPGNPGKKIAEINGEYTGSEAVDIPADIVVDSVIFNRKFVIGTMSTIMLPFSVDTSKFEGGMIYRFKRVEVKKNVWTVKIGRIYTKNISANTPYLVLPTATDLTFNGAVTLNTSTQPSETLTYDNWEFKGAYAYKAFKDDPEFSHIYGFAGQARKGVRVGEFVKVGTGASIVSLRAYLISHETKALSKKQAGSKINYNVTVSGEIHVDIVDENDNVVETGVLNTVTGELRMNGWFDVNGRRLNSTPTVRGNYYHNGKHVIIK